METQKRSRALLLSRRAAGVSTLPRLIAFVILLSLPLILILTVQFLPSAHPPISVGQVVDRDIKSLRRVTFVSQISTKEQRDLAESQVPDSLRYDATVYRQQMEAASNALQKITSIRNSFTGTDERKDQLARNSDVKLSADATDALLALDAVRWQATVTSTLQFLDGAMRNNLTTDQANAMRNSVAERLDPTLSANQVMVAGELVGNFLKPTMVVDKAATDRARRDARDAVPAVLVTVEKGETILRNGEIARDKDLEKLEAAGVLNPDVHWQDVAGIGLLVVTMTVILGGYIYLTQRRLLYSDRKMALLVVVIVAAVLAAKLTIPGRDVLAYVFPFAAVSMLVTTLVDSQVAALTTVMLAILLGYVSGNFTGNAMELTVVYLASGLVGALGVRNAERLNRFFLAGGAVALVSFAIYLAFRLLTQDYGVSQILVYAFASLVHGALAAVLTIGTFTILGHIFGIPTSFHLLELAHPNQPLLRRLLTEAPGTYHHSIIVGNLAERAAEMVEADPLLVRVGSYYHDIGKIPRAEFFVENQLSGENIHDHLEPEVSAAIISSHVRDGMDLARRYHLPLRVQDFIAEHHGTRMVSFFYQQACKKCDKNEVVNEQIFHYPGPRPQSKETAIVMLADSVEAAARAMKGRTPEDMDRLVDDIVIERLAEHQLDDCLLTLKDIQKVREAFKAVLRGVFHPRLEYPAIAQTPALPKLEKG